MPSTHQSKDKFIEIVQRLVRESAIFKITFSKARHQNKHIINAYLRSVVIKNEMQYSITHRYQNKDEVKNYGAGQMPDVIDNMLGNLFFNAVLFTETDEYTLQQNKKGNAFFNQRPLQSQQVISTTHDHQKTRAIPAKQSWLQVLGLAGIDGKILDKSQDKYRQINKFIELIDHLIKDFPNDQIITIADLACGKGYLTFALYDHLVNNKKMRVRITGYDLKQETITLCYQTAIKEGFVGLTFQLKDINDVNVAGSDMVIALHACDIATDIAIAKGIKAGVKYIVASPCCHKQIRAAMKGTNKLSSILTHGILAERQAEILTDGLRALIMEGYGYKTQVFEFISTEHTSKNLMITGIKSTPNPDALHHAHEIMKAFGIEYHHLEKLLEA